MGIALCDNAIPRKWGYSNPDPPTEARMGAIHLNAN